MGWTWGLVPGFGRVLKARHLLGIRRRLPGATSFGSGELIFDGCVCSKACGAGAGVWPWSRGPGDWAGVKPPAPGHQAPVR